MTCVQQCPPLTAQVVATFTKFKRTKSKPDALNLPVIHQHICARTYAGVGEQVTRENEETSQNAVPVAFTYFHRTLPPNSGSSPAPSPPRPPPGHTGAALSESSDHAVARALHAGVRMRSIYRPHRRMRRAREPPSPTPSTNPRALPSPRDPPPWGWAAPPHRPPGLRGSGRAKAGGAALPGQPAVPAPRTAAPPPGGARREREARGGGAEGRGARPLGYLLGQGHCALPRLLGCSAAPGGVSRQRAEGRGDRSSHTRTHTRTAGGGAAAAAEAAALPCSARAAAAQRPPRNGAAVTWGTGTSKVLPPLRHTAAAAFLLLPAPPGALASLTENSARETAAELAAAPVNEIRHHRRAGQEENVG